MTVMKTHHSRIRVLHVVYRFSVGGLENVVAQLINRLPAERFEHILLSLTTCSDFIHRIARDDVQFIALNKPAGHAIPLYPRLWRLLRQLKPDVIHTCNLAALELVPVAWAAGIPIRIHAEHGWDVHDVRGDNRRYQLLRRLYRPFVTHYVAVSPQIDHYLAQRIGIPARRRSLIANGVDTDVFIPDPAVVPPADFPFILGQHWMIGTVGRMQTVKNQTLLARAFVQLILQFPAAAERARLIMVGDGDLRAEVEQILIQHGVRHLAWVPGARHDIAVLLQCFNCFVLPSLTEGTSCTLQEAMATGLPSVVTAVGGTPALVIDGGTSQLVQSDDVNGLTQALWLYLRDPALAIQHGHAARQHALQTCAIDHMVAQYAALFAT